MYRWAVLWQASTLLFVGGTLDFRFFTRQRLDQPNSQVNCFEMPKYNVDNFARKIYDGWRFPRQVSQIYSGPTTATFLSRPLLGLNEISPRIDRLLPDADDIVKEHAKLVQDINGLKQLVFVSPFTDESRDYEDSIFQDIIETTTRLPKTKPTSKPLSKTTKGSIPIVLLGGASNQRQIVRSQPIKFPKTSISLVGTSVSPLQNHPYPFVVQGSAQRPLRVCMSSTAAPYSTTRRPSLWERLLSAIIPR